MAKKQKKRIILTGAQGTGKTTLMNELSKDGTRTLSVARQFATDNNWSAENGTNEEYQKNLFKTLKKELSSKKNYISDRGLTCVAAYTFEKAVSGEIAKEVADSQYIDIVKFANDNPDALLAYVPVEFDIEDDGVRNVDKDHQAAIDFLIRNILETSGIKYITVTGSVEDRVKQIEDALSNM